MALDSSLVIEATNVAAYLAVTPPHAVPDAVATATALDAFDWATLSPTLSAGSGAGEEYLLIGHTSDTTEIGLSPNIEGGDTRSSKQATGIRRGKARAIWTMSWPVLQLDNNTLNVITGGGDATGVDSFLLPKNFVIQEATILVVLRDAAANMAIHVPRASGVPDGDISIAGDGLTEASLVWTFMDDSSVAHIAAMYRDGLGVSA